MSEAVDILLYACILIYLFSVLIYFEYDNIYFNEGRMYCLIPDKIASIATYSSTVNCDTDSSQTINPFVHLAKNALFLVTSSAKYTLFQLQVWRGSFKSEVYYLHIRRLSSVRLQESYPQPLQA